MPTRLLRIWVLLTVAGAAACATGTPSSTTTPAPATPAATQAADPTGLLEPSEAAVRSAGRATLTGMELGRMWTFQDPPLKWWAEGYEFEPTPEWLDQVRLASLRYGDGCSASFVSQEGLVMTNHHCARGCIEELSSEESDYLEDGFHASTRGEELVCPGLFLDQLQSVDDVTERVLAAGRDAATDTAKTRAQEEVSATIEEECEEATGLTCQVVSLYHGGRFHLYRYQRFEPVKLVFAPEHQAASFGGDPDNFTYPRYAMDVAFVRAYQNETEPVRTENWFRWDADGAAEGEAVFVVGNPGGTSRLLAVSQVMYEKQRRHPYIVQYLEDVVQLYRWIGTLSPQAERSVREQLASMENSLKAYSGQLSGLQDTLLIGRKIRWEAQLREAVEADPELRSRYGDVWDRLAAIQRAKVPVAQRVSVYDFGFLGDPHIGLGGELVRFVRESARPEAERLEDYDAERLAEIEEQLLAPSPANPEIATRLLAIRLRLARNFLPAEDPFVRAAMRSGETPMEAARRIVQQSRLMEPEFRRRLIEGGTTAVEAESDVGLQLARILEDQFHPLSAELEELEATQTVQEERLAQALFAVKGTEIPPDATFTLRITDGVVRRYPYNGTLAPPKTSFWGIYERANNFDNEMPFRLPASYEAARDRVDLDTPLNFVTTDDITGGNSGSPMLNRDAEIVGVAFDGNIESLPNEWLFGEETARTVGVHSAGIVEALRSIYRAEGLVRELMGEDQD